MPNASRAKRLKIGGKARSEARSEARSFGLTLETFHSHTPGGDNLPPFFLFTLTALKVCWCILRASIAIARAVSSGHSRVLLLSRCKLFLTKSSVCSWLKTLAMLEKVIVP